MDRPFKPVTVCLLSFITFVNSRRIVMLCYVTLASGAANGERWHDRGSHERARQRGLEEYLFFHLQWGATAAASTSKPDGHAPHLSYFPVHGSRIGLGEVVDNGRALFLA